MIPFYTLLHALGEGQVNLGTGTFEMLFLDNGADPAVNAGDAGWAFESDITDSGATILHRETVPNVTWANRLLDADNFTINDPGSGTVASVVMIKRGGGDATTHRVIAYANITDHIFDGAPDQFRFHDNGIFRLEL